MAVISFTVLCVRVSYGVSSLPLTLLTIADQFSMGVARIPRAGTYGLGISERSRSSSKRLSYFAFDLLSEPHSHASR